MQNSSHCFVGPAPTDDSLEETWSAKGGPAKASLAA